MLEVSQLQRETRTELELAVVARAPSELLERPGSVAGLLEVDPYLGMDTVTYENLSREV